MGQKDVSLEVCNELARMAKVLSETPDESLSFQNLTLKRNEGNFLTTLIEGMEQFKTQIADPEPGKSHPSTQDGAFCKHCGKPVNPTLHDTCPECGEFL
jgi:hypothetical protein